MAKVYKHQGPMGFAPAWIALLGGRKICREGWNGKRMFLVLHKNNAMVMIRGIPEAVPMQDFVIMYTAQGTAVPWLASQTDVLASDWIILDEEWFNDGDRRNSASPSFPS